MQIGGKIAGPNQLRIQDRMLETLGLHNLICYVMSISQKPFDIISDTTANRPRPATESSFSHGARWAAYQKGE